MRIFLLLLIISSLFGYDLLCLVGKNGDKWLEVEKQLSLHCDSEKLKINAVRFRQISDLFVYEMPNKAVLFCEKDWVWSFRKLIIIGKENFKSGDCKSFYKK